MLLEEILAYLPVIIPLAVVQLGLMAAALVHALRHPNYKTGNMVVWVIVILMVSVIGPVLYFAIGRGEGEGDGDGEDEGRGGKRWRGGRA